MKILVLSGSPRTLGNTSSMVSAFVRGAEEAGHEVVVVPVAKKKIAGCCACEFCHTTGNGVCAQKDDMTQVLQDYAQAQMMVLASPIYCFGLTGQLQCALSRTHALGKVGHIRKMALLLSSGAPDAYDGAIAQYKSICRYLGAENEGIFTKYGRQSPSPELLEELFTFGRELGNR